MHTAAPRWRSLRPRRRQVLNSRGYSRSGPEFAEPTAQSPNAADPAEIVWRMVAQNETRARQLNYFKSQRHYHIEFHGLGRSMAADMNAQVIYSAGSGKTFHVIDESGSHLLLNHVLIKLLETEQEDSREQKAALTPFNYNFTFDTQTNEDGRPLYVFSSNPGQKTNFSIEARSGLMRTILRSSESKLNLQRIHLGGSRARRFITAMKKSESCGYRRPIEASQRCVLAPPPY